MRILLLALLMVFPFPSTVRAAEAAFPFAEATIDGLQARMASGELSARALTAAFPSPRRIPISVALAPSSISGQARRTAARKFLTPFSLNQ